MVQRWAPLRYSRNFNFIIFASENDAAKMQAKMQTYMCEALSCIATKTMSENNYAVKDLLSQV